MSDATHTIGNLVQLACTWEVLARKAGNVCPGREFPDLTVNDFLASASAIAPILEDAPHQPLGVTILHAIQATRRVVATNTNLGIVLLLAPLASVPLDEPLMPGLSRILDQTTIEDARDVYAAIRLAKPGGLGNVKEQDVKGEPTLPLRDVMALAMDRDLIAAQYATDYAVVLGTMTPWLAQGPSKNQRVERAIIELQLYMLFRNGDDLIRRKLGSAEGGYRMSAVKILEHGLDKPRGKQAFRDLDTFLRSDNHARNPGTTADLIAATLFVALRDRHIAPTTPFIWEEHPFEEK